MDKKKIIFSLLLTFIVGTFPSWFINSTTALLDKPLLTPPNIVFPIVWSILYLLMSISLYIIWKKDKFPIIYLIQLIVNSLWTVIFFGLKLRLLAFIWIILLIILVIIMLKKFKEIDNIAFKLNIPYLIWIIFASYLNLGFYLLNK